MLRATTLVMIRHRAFNIETSSHSNRSAKFFADEHEQCRKSRICECNKVSIVVFDELAVRCRCDVASYWDKRIWEGVTLPVDEVAFDIRNRVDETGNIKNWFDWCLSRTCAKCRILFFNDTPANLTKLSYQKSSVF